MKELTITDYFMQRGKTLTDMDLEVISALCQGNMPINAKTYELICYGEIGEQLSQCTTEIAYVHISNIVASNETGTFFLPHDAKVQPAEIFDEIGVPHSHSFIELNLKKETAVAPYGKSLNAVLLTCDLTPDNGVIFEVQNV